MTAKFHLVCLLAALTFVISPSVLAGDKTAPLLGSQYPSTTALQNYFALHTNAAWHLQHSNLLVVSVFYRDDCIDCNVLEYFVTSNGQERDHRRSDEAREEPRQKKLAEKDFEKLRQALAELPRKDDSPWLWELAVVSHRAGTNWVTHTYDRSAPSQALRQIFAIVGERKETKPK